MESDGTYLMHTRNRLAFNAGFQVGVTHIINRPTYFLFDDIQTHVLRTGLGTEQHLEIIGHIWDAAEYEILNSCQSGHSIRSDLVMSEKEFETLKSYVTSVNSMINEFIPRTFWKDQPLNLFGGIWEDEEQQLHVDVSSWVLTLEEALLLGNKYNQETIWDWSIMKCRCCETGEILH